MSAKNNALDRRTCSLGRAIFNLRQDIDIHRIIGLNVSAMREAKVRESFFGHVQKLAHSSIAIGFCKIFEYSSRNPLCSIPALISTLPRDLETAIDLSHVHEYARLYGGDIHAGTRKHIIESTYNIFKSSYTIPLARLRHFRDKAGVHLEDAASEYTLASHEHFEELWMFANKTYCVIHKEFNDVGPALMRPTVGVGLLKTLKSLGVATPQRDFQK